jgi:transcription elongation factor Elf1
VIGKYTALPPGSVGACPKCGGLCESSLAKPNEYGILCCPVCMQMLTFKVDCPHLHVDIATAWTAEWRRRDDDT